MSTTVHKGAIGNIVVAPAGTAFLREVKRQDKSKWCCSCKMGKHTQCRSYRQTIDRVRRPCECPCDLAELDPNL